MAVAVLIALIVILVSLVAVALTVGSARSTRATSEGFLIAGYTNLGPEDTDGPSCVLGSCCQ